MKFKAARAQIDYRIGAVNKSLAHHLEFINHAGDIISIANLQKEGLISAELDSNEMQRAGRFSRHFLDERLEIVLETIRRQLKRK